MSFFNQVLQNVDGGGGNVAEMFRANVATKTAETLKYKIYTQKNQKIEETFPEEILTKEIVDPHKDEDFNVITGILKKPGFKRTELDLDFLRKGCLSVKFIQELATELDPDTFLQLFRELKLEVCPAGTKLQKSREKSRNWHFILKGAVYVVTPRKKPKKLKKTTTKRHLDDQQVLQTGEDDENPEVTEEPPITEENRRSPLSLEEEIQWGHPGCSISLEQGFGASFGELAGGHSHQHLQQTSQQGAERPVAIIAKEDTVLGRLTHDSYDRILAHFNDHLLKIKVQFLQTVSILQEWSCTSLAALTNNLNVLCVNRNHVFFKEGDPCDFLYFIRSGEIEISKLVTEDKEDKEIISDKDYLANLNAIWDQNIKKSHSKRCKIALLTDGGYFGDEDILVNQVSQGPRTTRAVCMSMNAEVYSVSREKFLEISRNEVSLGVLHQSGALRSAWRANQIGRTIDSTKKTLLPSLGDSPGVERQPTLISSKTGTGTRSPPPQPEPRSTPTSPKGRPQVLVIPSTRATNGKLNEETKSRIKELEEDSFNSVLKLHHKTLSNPKVLSRGAIYSNAQRNFNKKSKGASPDKIVEDNNLGAGSPVKGRGKFGSIIPALSHIITLDIKKNRKSLNNIIRSLNLQRLYNEEEAYEVDLSPRHGLSSADGGNRSRLDMLNSYFLTSNKTPNSSPTNQQNLLQPPQQQQISSVINLTSWNQINHSIKRMDMKMTELRQKYEGILKTPPTPSAYGSRHFRYQSIPVNQYDKIMTARSSVNSGGGYGNPNLEGVRTRHIWTMSEQFPDVTRHVSIPTLRPTQSPRQPPGHLRHSSGHIQ